VYHVNSFKSVVSCFQIIISGVSVVNENDLACLNQTENMDFSV